MTQPWRFWITGGAAAVWAAATQKPAADGDGRHRRRSGHSLAETVRRIERTARERGIPVFAKFIPRPPATPAADGEPPTMVLVLGSDEEHTPIVQPAPDAALQLPLTVWVTAPDTPAGSVTEVEFTDSVWLVDQADVPPEVADRVAALPELIDTAIRS